MKRIHPLGLMKVLIQEDIFILSVDTKMGSKSIVGVEFHPILLNKKFQKTTCISYYTVLF